MRVAYENQHNGVRDLYWNATELSLSLSLFENRDTRTGSIEQLIFPGACDV